MNARQEKSELFSQVLTLEMFMKEYIDGLKKKWAELMREQIWDDFVRQHEVEISAWKTKPSWTSH
ncbi:MAG: hypothetical protein R3A11_06870 [Bdellovibrionota bacterium]